MLDFGALPPEINSARIYAGPGSGPLMAAASAWNSVAGELNSGATGYGAVITRLANEEWMGSASASMAQAATPYVTWMGSTAAQAEQAATQATAAAGAYETAFAAHVPPPLIAANRAQLAQAVSTNVLGQNTPVIAQLEAQYGEMWAQDAAAMYNYAGQAATATKVAQFDPPVATTTPAAQALQSTAVTNAANTAATSTSSQSVLSGLTAQLPRSLQSLATPTASSATSTLTDPLTEIWFLLTGQTTLPTNLGTFLTGYNNYASFFYNTEGLPYFSIGMANNFVQTAKTLGVIGGAAPAAAGGAAKGAAGGLGGLGSLGGGGPVAAGIGNAGSVGRLSVPPAWGGASAALPATSAPMPISSVAAAPEATGGAGNLLGGMPLAGAGAGASGSAPRYGFRPTVMARPPFAG